MKEYTVKIRSKNHSLNELRGDIVAPFRAVVRLGSTTSVESIWPKAKRMGNLVIEINKVDAINNSRSKLLMKSCFAEAEVPQADWYLKPFFEQGEGWYLSINGDTIDKKEISIEKLPYPILAKRVFGFKGKGMRKLNNQKELETFVEKNKLDGYYFEKYYKYPREYRLHCTEDGCFYAVRKMLKEDTKDEDRWFRNDSNCIWVTEYQIEKNVKGEVVSYNEQIPNKTFDKPSNWADIEANCVKALRAVGLHLGAFDVKVQSAKDKHGNTRDNPLYIIIEVNSAPSFGSLTLKKYREKIPDILNKEFYKLIA